MLVLLCLALTACASRVVFTGIGRRWSKEGVVVKKSGKQIAYLPCQGAWTSALGPALFEQAAIPQALNDFAIPSGACRFILSAHVPEL